MKLNSKEFLASLEAVVGKDGLLVDPGDRYVYECDGYTMERSAPDAVVLPTSAEQVRSVVRLCRDAHVPFVPRGAGTSLSGGRCRSGAAS